jgi:hypothetical protein
MARIGTLLALLAFAACGPGHADDDTSDDDAGVDAAAGMGGLRFRFEAADLGDSIEGLTVETLVVNMRDVRALGDAAPGDERTTQDAFQLLLATDGGDLDEIRFDEAPPGRYSAFEFVVDSPIDEEAAWQMDGTVELPDGPEEFLVEDIVSRPISLPLTGVEVAPGTTVRVTVQVDVVSIVEGVDWESAPVEDDARIVDEDYAGIGAVRNQFALAFSVTIE